MVVALCGVGCFRALVGVRLLLSYLYLCISYLFGSLLVGALEVWDVCFVSVLSFSNFVVAVCWLCLVRLCVVALGFGLIWVFIMCLSFVLFGGADWLWIFVVVSYCLWLGWRAVWVWFGFIIWCLSSFGG